MSRKSIWDTVRERALERLESSGRSAADVLREAEIGGSFFSEIRHPKGTGKPGRRAKNAQPSDKKPKKKTISHASLEKLAPVLDCDVDYFYGRQDKPRGGFIYPLMDVTDYCAESAFHIPGKLLEFMPRPMLRPIEQFPPDAQSVYIVVDDHARHLEITQGCSVIAVDLAAINRRPHPADVILRRAENESGLVEFTISTGDHADGRDGRTPIGLIVLMAKSFLPA